MMSQKKVKVSCFWKKTVSYVFRKECRTSEKKDVALIKKKKKKKLCFRESVAYEISVFFFEDGDDPIDVIENEDPFKLKQLSSYTA
jgi:hypothetical protein